MITTTLKALLQHKPSVDGYNKLACRITNNKYDADCRKYVPYECDEPISLQTILESNGLYEALWALRACEQTPELIRAERLYAVWCVRQVQQHLTDQRSIAALDVAERHANGLATDTELETARINAMVATRSISNDAVTVTGANAMDAAMVAAWHTAVAAVRYVAWYAARASAWDAARAAQKQMFIDVFCGESINIDPFKNK